MAVAAAPAARILRLFLSIASSPIISRSRRLDSNHRPRVPIQSREHVEDYLQEILSIEQLVRREALIAIDERRPRVHPLAFDTAANVAERHPDARVVSNALDFP